jgi:hypothetical protein
MQSLFRRLVLFMVFNALFNNISVISLRQFYWWRNPEKTIDVGLKVICSTSLLGLLASSGLSCICFCDTILYISEMTEHNVILYTEINVETVIECSLCPIIYNNLYLEIGFVYGV